MVALSSAIRLSETAVSALRVAGPAFFLGMQGSSLLTARTILQDKSTGALSPLPFVSLFTNCVVWALYGLLRKDSTVLIPNVIGVFSGLTCVAAYQSQNKAALPAPLYSGALFVIVLAGLLATKGNYNLIGSIGCGLAVLVMGSPLATLSSVIKTKSTAAMPFTTSLMGFCNSLCWSAYGLLVANDVMIYGPNLVGFFLSSIQMALFVLFGLPPAKSPVVKPIF